MLQQLRKQGIWVTRSQLLRWQHRELIPHPRRHGKGRGKGTAFYYPLLTVAQAAALAYLLDGVRSLDEAGWMLWCLGFPVTDFARALLHQEITKQGEALVGTLIRHERGDPRTLIARSGGRHPLRGTAHIRSPQGPLEASAVPPVVEIALQVLQGNEPWLPDSTDDRWGWVGDVLEAMNPELDREAAADPAREYAPSLVVEAAHLLAREANLSRIREALKKVSDAQLVTIRNEAQFRFESVGGPLGLPPATLPRPMFWMYFAFRVVSPTLAKATLQGIRSLGWTRPPPSPLNRFLTDIRSGTTNPTPSPTRKKRTHARH